MHTMLSVAVALLASVACAWQVNLWPTHSYSPQLSSLQPVTVNDALVLWPYVGGPVYAVNTTTKKLLWGDTFESVSLLVAVPASNVVLVATSDFVFGYHVATGKLLWANDTLASVGQAAPVVFGDLVVFNSNSDYNTASGIVAFSAATGDVVYTAFPSITGGTAVMQLSPTVGGFSSTYYFTAFDIATGKQLWQVAGSTQYSQYITFVAAGEGMVAVANSTAAPAAFAASDREVILLNMTTGATMYRLRAMSGASSYSRYARIYKGHFYALVNEAELQCFDLQTGYMVWALPLTYASSGTFQYSGDRMVMATQVNYYYNPPTYSIVDARTGKAVLSMTNRLSSTSSTTFALQDDVLVIPNQQGFAAYNITTGAALFENNNAVGVSAASLRFVRGGLVWTNGTAVFGQSTAAQQQ